MLSTFALQILFTFLSAVVKLQISKRAQLTTDATYSSGSSSKGFDDAQYMFGQLLKETFLNLGPTFVKGWVVMLGKTASSQGGGHLARIAS